MDYESAPLNAVTRTVLQSISIISVDVFILISGWFGIKARKKGFLGFLFNCLFLTIGIYLVSIIGGISKLSPVGILQCFFFSSGYWFIRAYILLYILSPVLNTFIENTSRAIYRNILIGFFVFQIIYGFNSYELTFKFGYSTISFIGLYLLARYLHRYSVRGSGWGIIFLISIIANSIFYYITVRMSIKAIDPFTYNNPITILGAVSLLLWFKGIKIQPNKYINWISKSTFAVYIIHVNPNLFPYFLDSARSIYAHTNGISCFTALSGFVVCVFFASILLDQPRKWIWSKISDPICRYEILRYPGTR